MAVIASPSQPFFENKDRAFWNLQAIGWAAVFLQRVITGFANDQPWTFVIPLMISMVTGYSLTLIMSVVYRNVIDKRPVVTYTVALAVVLVATILYAFIDAWVFQLQSRNPDAGFGQLFLGSFYNDGMVLGAWSALYFAINYYLRVEEQADKLVMLDAQATSAQLAMLRYQLNPHFLFNTLNSISTLVLMKQTEPANAMLSRLSAFLRYTLANEPTAQVPLAQEVETLKLYLDIEKMRFEDRLRARFDIDSAVAKARLPSLLLQPLVENAIKYAVTPKEEGAEIAIQAQLAGQNVRIVVSDTGPGLNAVPDRSTVSTGVGLANIRDRLAQAYGERHRFEISTAPGGGFQVVIEIPYSIETPQLEPVFRPKKDVATA